MKRTAMLTAALMFAGMTSVSLAHDGTMETKQNEPASVTSEAAKPVVKHSAKRMHNKSLKQHAAAMTTESTKATSTNMNENKGMPTAQSQSTAKTVTET